MVGSWRMKIKQPSRAHLLRSRNRKLSYHSWLLPEQPKKVGRLSQLNKHNHRAPSEFLRMAWAIDNKEAGGLHVR